MNSSTDSQSRSRLGWLAAAGWLVLILIGIGLVWLGFLRPSGGSKSQEADLTATAAIALAESLTRPTATVAPVAPTPPPTFATAAPLPTTEPTIQAASTESPQPTDITAPQPTANPNVTAGALGVNVRGGPGTNYTLLGTLDPGAQAPVTGRYGSWWQISYNGTSGWVFGDIVTAANVESVPEVQPPPAPTAPPATAVPTAVPPTPTVAPQPTADARGLVADSYQVEDAPGPYPLGSNIWFNMWVSNRSTASVEFTALGTWVQENGQFQMSWTNSAIQPHQQFDWRDHLYSNHITAAGTYHLYLRVCFADGVCANLAGPVEVVVQ